MLKAQPRKLDQLHENNLLSVKASYQALTNTISAEELRMNKMLHAEIRKIRRQIFLIEELSQSFEY